MILTIYIFGVLFSFALLMIIASGKHEHDNYEGRVAQKHWKDFWEKQIWIIFTAICFLSWIALVFFIILMLIDND